MSRTAPLLAAAALACLPSAARAGWINEIHYDNAGADIGEFVEIALPDTADVNDFTVELYNGAASAANSGAAVYGTISVSNFASSSSVNGITFYELQRSGIQNGVDGLALVRGSGADAAVVESGGIRQFLSYEGSFTAIGGTAQGLASTDIDVRETGSTAVGFSLQLTGAGRNYSDFTWANPMDSTAGAANGMQAISPVPEPGSVALFGLLLAGGAVRRRYGRRA